MLRRTCQKPSSTSISLYGTALSGTPEQSLRWKRALAATNVALDMPVGHFSLGAAYDAYHAYHAALGAKAVRANADPQFFIGYAQSWRTKLREAARRRGVLTDSHAPASYRTATVRNIDAWYRAFDVQPGQALYLPPAERVRVW